MRLTADDDVYQGNADGGGGGGSPFPAGGGTVLGLTGLSPVPPGTPDSGTSGNGTTPAPRTGVGVSGIRYGSVQSIAGQPVSATGTASASQQAIYDEGYSDAESAEAATVNEYEAQAAATADAPPATPALSLSTITGSPFFWPVLLCGLAYWFYEDYSGGKK